MDNKKFLQALEEKDLIRIKKEMMLLFEEKLERKIWKIYNSIEDDLKKELKKDQND